MDIIFGTYINDELKLANHQAVRKGLQHQHNISPIDPTPEDEVTIEIVTSSDIDIDQAALYCTTDESIPAGSRGKASNGQAIAFKKSRIEWDSLVWDYLTYWTATIPKQAENTLVQYIISAWKDGGDEIYGDYPNAEKYVQHRAMIHFKNIPEESEFTPHDPSIAHVFNYHADTSQPPEWAKDAIIYHIFVDRFYHGDGKEWIQTDDLHTVVGGTLWGVRDKLDYIAELGINCIWLSPVWESPTSHGYDTVDYKKVESRLGGDEALRTVIEGAHQRGIRVLLDMACNHVSNEHPIFLEALNDESSPYRDWFYFDDSYEHGYEGFFNVKTMPEINMKYPPAREWMIDNALYWLREFNIDGYRLDYAAGCGPDFWSHFRKACKAVKPDCLLFGEIINAPNNLRHYIGRLDGSLNFAMNDALRRTFAWKVWDSAQFKEFAERHQAYFPENFIMPTFLDNHDMNRFSLIADNDSDALKQAATAQFQLRDIPVIYYGTEVRLIQKHNANDYGLDACRMPMVWDDRQDKDLLNFYKTLIKQRRKR